MRRRWQLAARQLAAGEGRLLSLWGEPDAVHMALEENGGIGVLSLACPHKRFPSVGRLHPPALRLERSDPRPVRAGARRLPGCPALARPWPLGAAASAWRPVQLRRPPAMPTHSTPAEGPPLHQIPVGPVHAGIIEPGHFRFSANGETVVRLEERLGYVHKGIDRLMVGAPMERAAKLAGRVSGDSTVAYADRIRARGRGSAGDRGAWVGRCGSRR